MQSTDLVFKSGRELAALIRTKQVSPVEVTTAFLDRVERLNPRVNAFLTILREEALAKARRAEQAIQAGHYIGPLHGLPYAPKDIIATYGHRTTNNSDVTKDNVTYYESTVTDRLNKAGAIMIGKLAASPFAMGAAMLTSFGNARNPWDLNHSPAGSSSGSGAALAAYMVPLSIGTDTGGSIRGPANANGIVGLKQTYGRVSRYGATTLAWTLDNAGPMTKTVADNADLLQVIAGHDPMDPTTTHDPVPDYSAALTGNVEGLRIGVPTHYFFEDTDQEADRAIRAAIQALVDMGATAVEIDIPHADHAGAALWLIAMAEAACFHEKRLKEHWDLFDTQIQRELGSALFYTATDYIKANRIRTILQNEMAQAFAKCDVMVVPGSQQRPAKLDTPAEARARYNEVTPSTPRRGNTSIGNMTGYPCLVVPCGFFSGTPTFPITMMLYGRPFDESTMYRVAHAYESATDWHKRRPPVG
ncbi:MAG: Asp-tRNA(Asn)/Glu-tRNA(Gln) amidotransferase GatCAB subunit A [Gemmatimonadetes bacterium]|nr:Asp-tRNA(Asn)/Glu-tRNA(Gln) amidotransferase GatCAB subunit A [Gemmatimonadota bacterium]